MVLLSDLTNRLRTRLEWIQGKLSLEGWHDYPLFSTKEGAGRSALIGTGLGCCLGFHACGFLALSAWQFWLAPPPHHQQQQQERNSGNNTTVFLAWQWCSYATAVAVFHLSEYFTTALYNPTAATADSFLVNHSTSYTAAALTSWTEFGLKCLVWPQWNLPPMFVYLGLALTMAGQTIRTVAMITAGQSFNHLIQTSKKENHTLVTHGIYGIFRHPSYVGFYYWSIGTQILLGNAVHAILFSAVSWNFFQRRIPYEEESLCVLFPNEYPAYVAQTWMGIPFIRSPVSSKNNRRKTE